VKKSPTIGKMLDIIRRTNHYSAFQQVLYYNKKVSGIVVRSKDHGTAYIPCFPSAIVKEMDTIFVDDISWSSLADTVHALETFYNAYEGKIPCKPERIVYERDVTTTISPMVVVGILTETHEFIPVQSEPFTASLRQTYSSLGIFEQSNRNTVDKTITASNSEEDQERIKTVEQILVESQFYEAFRITVRLLLNDYRYREQRQRILSELDRTELYRNKLDSVKTLLQKLAKPFVVFREIDGAESSEEISTCLNRKKCNSISYCLVDGACRLVIPQVNGINGEDNREFYFVKLADELLRYNRIRRFMFENTIQMIGSEYKINENEIVLYENQIFTDTGKSYFTNLIEIENADNIRLTYDNAEPRLVTNKKATLPDIVTESEYTKDRAEDNKPEVVAQCIVRTDDKIIGTKDSLYVRIFKDGKEVIYSNKEAFCTYQVIIDIYRNLYGGEMDIANLKKTLLMYYRNVSVSAIAKIWYNDKKITASKQKSMNTFAEVEARIREDSYYMTDIDFWILAQSYSLPIVLFCVCAKGMVLLRLVGEPAPAHLVLHPNINEDSYYFVRTPTENSLYESKGVPEYHLINARFPMPAELNEREGMTLQEFLEKCEK
jgi:hypothetical protein